MKIHSSAPKAAAPSSSQSSSAIGFEAPFQYAVTEADAVQLYQFQSSDTPPHTLDTTRPADEKEILAEISTMSTDQIMDLWQGIAEEPSTPMLTRIVIALQQRFMQADNLQEVSDRDEGVWTKATLNFGNGFQKATRLHKNGEAIDSSSTFSLPSRPTKEDRVSQTDSEVATLDELYQLLTEYWENDPTSGTSFHPAYYATKLVIGFVSNIGPCDGCKARIERFLAMAAEFIKSLGLHHAVEIELDVHYQGRNQATRKGVPTQYGYSDGSSSHSMDHLESLDHNDRKAVTINAFRKTYSVIVPASVASQSSASHHGTDTSMHDSSGNSAS